LHPIFSPDCLSPDSIIIIEFDEYFPDGIYTIDTSFDIGEERFARMSKCDLPEFDELLFLSSISLFSDYKSEHNRVHTRCWIKTRPTDIPDPDDIFTGDLHTEREE
jgi:hypothetical protein